MPDGALSGSRSVDSEAVSRAAGSTIRLSLPAIRPGSVAAVYAAGGVGWILLSQLAVDSLLSGLPGSVADAAEGLAFVVVTALALDALLDRAERTLAAARRQLVETDANGRGSSPPSSRPPRPS